MTSTMSLNPLAVVGDEDAVIPTHLQIAQISRLSIGDDIEMRVGVLVLTPAVRKRRFCLIDLMPMVGL
jgi:antitoxin component of MazEF toxin-antitoxin module